MTRLLGKEFQGVHQGRGVRSRLIGDQFEDAAVAALLFKLAQLPAGPPHDGMPPEDRLRRELEEPDEIIAAPDMEELVGEDGALSVGTQAGKQFGRQDHAREESERPDQGRQGTRRHQHVGHAPQAQPARELGDHRADGRRRRLGLADDVAKRRMRTAWARPVQQAPPIQIAARMVENDHGSMAGRLRGPIPERGLRVARGDRRRENASRPRERLVAPRRVRASSRSFSADRRPPRAAPSGKRTEAPR